MAAQRTVFQRITDTEDESHQSPVVRSGDGLDDFQLGCVVGLPAMCQRFGPWFRKPSKVAGRKLNRISGRAFPLNRSENKSSSSN